MPDPGPAHARVDLDVHTDFAAVRRTPRGEGLGLFERINGQVETVLRRPGYFIG